MTPRIATTVKSDLTPTLCRMGVLGNLGDGQLLEGFLGPGREEAEASFAALLERHGPMVLRVCRQGLGHVEDAQDAFQATFLVLAARARTIRSRDSLASWLHGTALRVCRRARTDAARRQAHEQTFGRERSGYEAAFDGDEPPIPELHEELSRLPEAYRSAVILCYLEGLSTEAAARRLGCPKGTVLSRLARARERLRRGLARRGIVAPAGLLAPGPCPEPKAVAAELVRATTEQALSLRAGRGLEALAASSHVARLAWSALVTTLARPGLILAACTAAAVLAVGAGAMLQDEKGREVRAAQTVRAVASQAASAQPSARRPSLHGSKAVPGDLAWAPVPPERWVDVLEMLAARSRANYENIRTWQGTYRIAFPQYLNANIAGSMGAPLIQGRIEPLIQESEFTVKFAADLPGGRFFQDKTSQAMRFRRIGKDEPVTIRNVGPHEGRMFTDGTTLVEFDPKERATTAFLPDHPDAQNKRIVRRWTAEESRGRTSPLDSDPRQFFGSPWDFLWRTPQIYADALRGRQGEDQLKEAARRLVLHQAEGPGGSWYWMETRLDGPAASKNDLFHTIIWSPEAGYQPVLVLMAWGRPEGQLNALLEWQWQRRDGVYIPSKFHRATYQDQAGTLSFGQTATLVDCVLNQPLDPHQFDYDGLGIQDGDVIVDHVARTVSAWRNGRAVKLGNFVR
jgi:RNA polymerase sigma factor (sigma-70 family)